MLIDERLKKLGINSPEDAAFYFPTEYKDYRVVIQNFDPYLIPVGQEAVFEGSIKGQPVTSFVKGKPRTMATITDGWNDLTLSMFGDCRAQIEEWQSASIVRIVATANRVKGKVYLNNAKPIPGDCVGAIGVSYPGKAKVVKSSTLSRLIPPLLQEGIPKAAIHLENLVVDTLGQGAVNKVLKGATTESLLWEIHQPKDEYSLEQASGVLDRLNTLYAAHTIINKSKTSKVEKGLIVQSRAVGALARNLPFELTEEQKKCVRTALNVMQSGRRFRGLLIGDVGSGKTATFLLIAATVLSDKGRVAILLPNAVIAEQVYNEFNESFGRFFSSLLVTNNTPVGEEASYQLLIGTTALNFRECGDFTLVICDEQQKLSIEQREQLTKGIAHTLEVSATPIPRSMALATHGAVETLIIKSGHVKKQIVTHIARKQDARAMFLELKKRLAEGGKALIVCPKRLSENGDFGGLHAAEDVAGKVGKALPGVGIRVAHSGLSSEENEQAIADVKEGRASVLVSTSLVEVGLTIKGLNFCMVYGAERFGLQTLHQIRGRLGRHGEPSVFYLYLPNNKVGEQTLERLNILVEHLDGFEVSRRDLLLRGAGDINSDTGKQHGVTDGLIRNRMLDIEKVGVAVDYLKKAYEKQSVINSV